jgi:hypothetical protein
MAQLSTQKVETLGFLPQPMMFKFRKFIMGVSASKLVTAREIIRGSDDVDFHVVRSYHDVYLVYLQEEA